MPNLRCPCGFIHSLSGIPDDGWVTQRDRSSDDVEDARALRFQICGRSIPANEHPRIAEWDRASRIIVDATGRLYECSKCGRILWKREGEKVYRVFKPEPDEAG